MEENTDVKADNDNNDSEGSSLIGLFIGLILAAIIAGIIFFLFCTKKGKSCIQNKA